MNIYIHTIPKAGTYLLAEYLECMGLSNSGFHVEIDRYLDTKLFITADNAKRPSATEVNKFFTQTLRELKHNEFAFGHLPAPICAWALENYKFICAYRNPRKTLLSEFLDFRYRRDDVEFVSREVIKDDHEAFVTYLRDHGPIHMSVFSEMLAVVTLFSDPLFSSYDLARVIFVNFDNFLMDSTAATAIAHHLGLDETRAEDAWKSAIAAETKTKATNLSIDRNSFWTEATEAAAASLNLEAYTDRARMLGLEL